jgi:hypothetical protein
VLSLTELVVCNLQFAVLIQRRECATVEKVMHMLQLPKHAAITCSHTHALLDDGPGEVVQQVERVLRVLGHHSHTGVEVRVLEVGHSLKALLSYGVPLIMNREESEWHLHGSSEAALAQGGEGDMCHQLDGVVELSIDDGSHPWLHWVEGYHHAGLTPV